MKKRRIQSFSKEFINITILLVIEIILAIVGFIYEYIMSQIIFYLLLVVLIYYSIKLAIIKNYKKK